MGEEVFSKNIDGRYQSDSKKGVTMNIGVIGYYGYGNIGDEVILQNLRYLLSSHQLLIVRPDFLPTAEAIARLNMLDYVLLGGGGLYNKVPPSPFDTFEQWADSLKVPIGVLGLGVETLDARFQGSMSVLVDKSSFFIVRDEESKQLIGHDKVQVAPDLTFYRPFRVKIKREMQKDNVCGVNLRSTGLGATEWIRAISALPCRKHAIPFSSHPDYNDHELLSAIDPKCPAYFDESAFAKINLIVGTAFHSIVFAIQNSIPAIAINYHPKVRRLMRQVDLEAYVLEWNEWPRLFHCYERVLAERYPIQRRMSEYTRAAEQELSQALKTVRQKIEHAPAAHAVSCIGTEPKVVVIVSCLDSAKNDIRATIETILKQMYRNLELILVVDSRLMPIVQQFEHEYPSVHCVQVLQGEQDWVTSSLDHSTGDYVTWLQAGQQYTPDGIATMLHALHGSPTVDWVYTDHYIVRNDVIERKVNTKEWPSSHIVCPSFLVRRCKAQQLRDIQTAVGNREHNHKNEKRLYSRAIHIPVGILLRPTTASENELYDSIVACGRSRLHDANRHFVRALELNSELLETVNLEVIDLFVDLSHNPMVTSSPTKLVEDYFSNLPPDAMRLISFKRKLISRIAMRRVFNAHRIHDWPELRRTIWPAIKNDLSWLKNRGVIYIVLESLFGPNLMRLSKKALRRVSTPLSVIRNTQHDVLP